MKSIHKEGKYLLYNFIFKIIKTIKIYFYYINAYLSKMTISWLQYKGAGKVLMK